jgi:hypothetical protein
MITRRRIFMRGTANSKATVEIATLEVLEGQLPRRALNLVREWARMHREELLEDWRFCRENTVPAKIEPLA